MVTVSSGRGGLYVRVDFSPCASASWREMILTPSSAPMALRRAALDKPGSSPLSRGSRLMMNFKLGQRGLSLSKTGMWLREATTQVRLAWLMMYSVVSGPRVS